MISLRSCMTQKVLAYFFADTGEEVRVNELARLLSLDTGNLARQLIKLESAGLLISRWQGQQRLYRLNAAYPLLKEYRAIVQSAFGVEVALKAALKKVKGIKRAFIFGSYAAGKMDVHSDIDVCVVGDHASMALHKAILSVQASLRREINAVSLSVAEFEQKQKKDPFIKNILTRSRIELI